MFTLYQSGQPAPRLLICHGGCSASGIGLAIKSDGNQRKQKSLKQKAF
jgi:hypothetical protein